MGRDGGRRQPRFRHRQEQWRAGSVAGGNRQSARFHRRRSQPRRQFRHPRDHRFGDGLLRASADARNRLRPPGAAVDDILAQFHLRQRRSLARPHYLGALRRLHELDPAARGAQRVQGRGMGKFRPPSLIYSMIDVLLGGRRGNTALRIEGRPYTTIETNLVKRLIEVVLSDAEHAFRPLSPVTFSIDRLETNPRFAAISRPANAAILVRLRIDMEDRGGNIELRLPYATIEPIRSVLLQMFMGEKFGRDPIWEGHFATEVALAEIAVDAVLYESDIPLKQLMRLKVGDTLPLEMKKDALVSVRCGSVTLTEGRMGRVGDRVAIRVTKPLRKPKTTLAMFERLDEQNKMMDAT